MGDPRETPGRGLLPDSPLSPTATTWGAETSHSGSSAGFKQVDQGPGPQVGFTGHWEGKGGLAHREGHISSWRRYQGFLLSAF